jgi:hypothetical protein
VASSSATSVDSYLAELTPERSRDVAKLRELCLNHLPAGLEEAMNWGMISYQVPFSTVEQTYNSQPLLFAAIASQKQYISLYLMSIYAFDEAREKFESDWRASGMKLNVGKACIRFRNLDSAPLDVIQRALGQVTVEEYVSRYLEVRGSARKMRK